MSVRLRKPGRQAGAHILRTPYFVSILDWMQQGVHWHPQGVCGPRLQGGTQRALAARKRTGSRRNATGALAAKAADDTSPRCPNCPPGCPTPLRRWSGGRRCGDMAEDDEVEAAEVRGTVGVSKQNPRRRLGRHPASPEDFEKGTGTSRSEAPGRR